MPNSRKERKKLEVENKSIKILSIAGYLKTEIY